MLCRQRQRIIYSGESKLIAIVPNGFVLFDNAVDDVLLANKTFEYFERLLISVENTPSKNMLSALTCLEKV